MKRVLTWSDCADLDADFFLVFFLGTARCWGRGEVLQTSPQHLARAPAVRDKRRVTCLIVSIRAKKKKNKQKKEENEETCRKMKKMKKSKT